MRLRQTDAETVDLLLDRAATAQDGGDSQAAMAFHSSVSNDRVSAVEKVLNLLNVMPDSEPAPDLAKRTLAFVDQMGGSATMREPTAPQIDHGRPVA
jgi:hypothetical protein